MTTQPGGFELYRLDRDLTRDELIDALSRTPARLREVLVSAAPGALSRPAPDGEWSPVQVLRHLRDAVQIYGMRFKWIILQDGALLADYDENRWAAQSPDGPGDLEPLLREVEAYRAETVRLLRSLSGEDWGRSGRHQTIGEVVLEPYVRHELAHEEQHLEQLRRVLQRP